MKKVLTCTLLISALMLPCYAKDKELHLQNIFISCVSQEDDITLDSVPLKGYAEYIEGQDVIDLVDDENQYVLNLKVPQKFKSKRLVDYNNVVIEKNRESILSRYHDPEHSVSASGNTTVQRAGDFAFGTIYNASIDTSQLEYSTGLFTRYEKSRFALSTAYKKTLLSTYGLQTDKLYIAPEIKLNKIFSVSEVISADMTRNRKAHELVLTINPLGKKDVDRMKLEFGAGQTYDQTNSLIRSQVRFNTTFKL